MFKKLKQFVSELSGALMFVIVLTLAMAVSLANACIQFITGLWK